jgi:hypothetical protein
MPDEAYASKSDPVRTCGTAIATPDEQGGSLRMRM